MTDLSCAEARALVSDYIDGELDASSAGDLEQHLVGCPSCPPLYASLIATLADLKAIEPPAAGLDDLVHRVVAAVQAIGGPGAVGAAPAT
ncbi:MAG: zf-HC2 domain-containing protein [Actinomycetota bacterium]|nr:zf-HC2 domain-containing protein [Actinomycetota bacterium]